jgi:hypothetical protein
MFEALMLSGLTERIYLHTVVYDMFRFFKGYGQGAKMPHPLPPLYRPLNAIVLDANMYRDKLNEMKLTLKIVVWMRTIDFC